MLITDTKRLVLPLQEGSLDALGDLYDRYNRLVYRTALGVTGDPESASDLLQEVFLRLYRFAGRIDPERPLEPWLYRMTANLSYTYVKRRKWVQPIEDVSDWLAGPRKTQPTYHAEQNEAWRQVEEAIQTLPLPQRMVIVLYYINECSLQEVAEILEIPAGTVKSRLHYARQALKENMSISDSVVQGVNFEFT
ncbi:MAG: sigma-70 family RNA polymerase sigma factor [Chloroflexi bacterium]|nr:sigma-70 family RNA polymerase sigma factor [Chloroflexota bacterium]